MFEGFKKRFVSAPEDTPEEQQKKEQNRNALAKAGVVAGLAAVGGIAANENVTDLHTHAGSSKTEAGSLQTAAAQERGPQGATVTINPEAGQATVHIPAPAMEAKPTTVNLEQKPVEIRLDEEKPVTVDLSHKVTTMRAPE